MCDPNEFALDKLAKKAISQRQYKDTLLVLYQLTCLIKFQQEQNHPQSDELNFLDMIESDKFQQQQMSQQSQQRASSELDTLFNNQMRMLEDPNFLREYKTLAQQSHQPQSALISPEMNRLIKSLNSASTHQINCATTNKVKSTNVCDLINEMTEFREKLLRQIEDNKEILHSVICQFLLLSTSSQI